MVEIGIVVQHMQASSGEPGDYFRIDDMFFGSDALSKFSGRVSGMHGNFLLGDDWATI